MSQYAKNGGMSFSNNFVVSFEEPAAAVVLILKEVEFFVMKHNYQM